MLTVKIKQLDSSLPLPRYAREGDAGCDLYSRINTKLGPGERKLIPTGMSFAIPNGYAGFIQPKSGLALMNGIGILNAPGLIDPGYRGEIGVVLINHDKEKGFEIKKGDKICQLVVQKVEKINFAAVRELDKTQRGEAGFGSTG